MHGHSELSIRETCRYGSLIAATHPRICWAGSKARATVDKRLIISHDVIEVQDKRVDHSGSEAICKPVSLKDGSRSHVFIVIANHRANKLIDS